jgi:hypothetical protein
MFPESLIYTGPLARTILRKPEAGVELRHDCGEEETNGVKGETPGTELVLESILHRSR